jgi:hypothetical protein
MRNQYIINDVSDCCCVHGAVGVHSTRELQLRRRVVCAACGLQASWCLCHDIACWLVVCCSSGLCVADVVVRCCCFDFV